MRNRLSFLLGIFLCSTLSAVSATDMTSSILNPGFDGMGFGGWLNKGFQTQTNSAFNGKNFKAYAERWVASGNNLPDSYLLQNLTGLANGRYTLTVAAANTQDGSAAEGAYLVGNQNTTTIGAYNDSYSVTFYVVDGTAEIGIKLESCTGNWVAFDNFRLTQESTTLADLRAGLSALLTVANSVKESSMQSSALSTLNSAITTASSYVSNGSESNVVSAYATLKSAVRNARNSIFYTRTTSGSGVAPTVTTDTRYAVGRDIAFARSTVSGNDILEQGFCYSSTNTLPTVADDRSTRYIDHVGYIHVLDQLTPGTCYYIRAYAVTTSYAVGYGDVLRIYTLPSGHFTYNFNSSGDDNIDARIKGAMDGLIGYWNQTTSITAFTPTANYNSGVATADCSYGGWIRYGPSEDYQATGTAMHEALHGIGVGTHGSWNLHESNDTYGTWYGKRARDLSRFWDNNNTEYITGGGSHNWAASGSNQTSYTINGAHEDTHTDLQYYGCGLLAQAMCEDGMVPASGGFLPGYCFHHTDNTKYYLRNTHSSYGLNSSCYLAASGTSLQWTTYANDAAAADDDKAAWYIEFDPTTQYYYFKNVSTGRYIYYNGSSFSASGTAKNNYTQIHLHLGWWDATFGTGGSQVSMDTYYLMHPANTGTPTCLAADASNALTTATYSPAEAQTASRWMILTMDQADDINDAIVDAERDKVLNLIAKVRTLAASTHTDDTGTANSTLATNLATTETAVATATAAECATHYNNVLSYCKTFMGNTTPGASGYNITFLVTNPDMSSAEGWSGTSPTLSYTVAEFYQMAFDFYQTLPSMPHGRYRMKMQAFQRPGSSTDVFTDYKDGGTDDNPITATIYIGTGTQTMADISTEAQTSRLGVGNETEVTYSDETAYLPNDMQAGAHYFSNSYYDNTVEVEEFTGGTLQFGIKSTSYVTYDWTLFDNLRLYYFGSQTDGQDPAATADGYDITGAMAPYLSTYSQQQWTSDGIGTSGNGSNNHTNGDASVTKPYFESWTSSSGALSNRSIQQTITELPNGTYYIGGSFIASRQNDASLNITGTTFFAGDQSIDISTGNGVPERYSLRVSVTDGTLTYGVRLTDTNANWVAMDNFFLIFDGTADEYYAKATNTSPVRVVLRNPTMDEGTTGWTCTGDAWSTNTTTYTNFFGQFMERWVANNNSLTNSTAMQAVSLRQGNYTLQAAVNAVQQGNTPLSVSGVSLHFADKSVSCHTGNGAPQIYSVTARLEADDYDLGLRISDTDANWVAWDNVILYYYGNGLTPYETALALCRSAVETNEPSLPGAAQSALDDYEWTSSEYESKTSEEINTAITILNNGIAISNASQVATSLIDNADFTGGTNGMDVQGSGGSISVPTEWTFIRNYSGWNDTRVVDISGTKAFNAWAGSITQAELYQDLTGLPNGTYRLTADIKTDTDAQDARVALYGYGSADYIARSADAGKDISGSANDFHTYTVAFEVTNHTARIGIRSDHSYYQVKDIALEFVTNVSQASAETDAGYLRHDFRWSEATEFDATINKYAYAQGVTLYPTVVNQIIKARAGQLTNSRNVVVGGTCADFVITDGTPLALTSATGAFTATSASYTRNMPVKGDGHSRWGTLIMPMTLSSNGDVTFFQMTSVGDGQMRFSSLSGDIAPNTPVLFRLTEEAESLTLNSSGTIGLTTAAQSDLTTATDWQMVGTYSGTTLSVGSSTYYIAQDKFWAPTSRTVSIAPYRAWFQANDNNVKSFNIFIEDDTDGLFQLDADNGQLQPVYDLQGRRVTQSHKGIFIVNGRKTVIR